MQPVTSIHTSQILVQVRYSLDSTHQAPNSSPYYRKSIPC